MDTGYLDFVLQGMEPMFDAVPDALDRRLITVATMTRLLNCDSILDLSQTYGINKDAIYQALDVISPPRWLRRLVKKGRERLAVHFRRWQAGDPSFRSRHSITICADDFTRTTRGNGGGFAGLFYSGAEKGVVNGINLEVLCAVIGDGREVILLDVRIVPPPPKGRGRPPRNQNQWLRQSLCQLNSAMVAKGASLQGCVLSVDSAYVSAENVALVRELDMHVVSKLSANRLVTGDVDGPLTEKVELFAILAMTGNHRTWRDLRGEAEVRYQRNMVYLPSLRAQVLMVSFIHERDFVVYFSTNQSMKTITLRNVLRFRWQLERIFWVLKEDLGVGDIHNQKEARVETRFYLHFILVQVIRDAAGVFKCSPKDVVRNVRRSPDMVLHKLGFPCAFAKDQPWTPVRQVPLAA